MRIPLPIHLGRLIPSSNRKTYRVKELRRGRIDQNRESNESEVKREMSFIIFIQVPIVNLRHTTIDVFRLYFVKPL